MTDDRRVRRTRRILGNALTALILEKNYERITVQDILDRADVGRSTFYAHFRDKEALLMACFDGVRDDLRGEFAAVAANAHPGRGGPAAALFRHADRHRRIYQALCDHRSGSPMHRRLAGLIADVTRRHLPPGASDLPADAVAQFYATATVGLLQWWIDNDFVGGPTWIATVHERLTATALPAGAGGLVPSPTPDLDRPEH